ncbi:U3 small nucleolar RNA-interacting protein 2-like isoform X2 [Panonychus citri]|uniref:U3 small nucleolar RNA-interacting protein 2-like isoform X2 n=1 Tax=Panonychus citri TaxID=50023 RepID=UPI00230803A2|nr:U3 small nucleolar RNA-interacting protein 2-like isoform X2 [Panonychus citri]
MIRKRQLEKEKIVQEDLEDYSSSDEDEDEEDEEAEIDETPAQKRLRLAKKYLQEFSNQDNEKIIRIHKKVADTLTGPDLDNTKVLKNGHKLSVTCLVVSSDGKFIYSASKDGSIVKWDFINCKKLKTIPGGRKGDKDHVGHTCVINAIAISSDSKFLATGCKNEIINIWNTSDMKFVHTFKGHRGEVNGLAFRRAAHTLYSCSSDKTVKVWNVDDLCYVETLFGHQDKVTSIDCGLKEKPITSGGIDLSLRIWKIVEESQLVFYGHKGSIDHVKYIDEDHFISVGDDGIISLYGNVKKNAIFTSKLAHGEESSTANWIVSLATAVNTDLFATGSKDGHIRVWQCAPGFTKFELIFTIPVVGVVNCLQFVNDGDYLVAGIGREHRLGRWWNLKEAKNSIMIIPMLKLSNHQL